MTTTDKPGLAIGLRILSGILISGMYVCVKEVGTSVPLGEIVFFRSAFALIPLVIFLWVRHEFPSGLSTKRPWDHFLRASFGALALFASFAALARLNVAEAVLIAQLSPMLMAIAAVVLLSERLTIWRVGGLALGFIGVIVLVWPELDGQVRDTGRLIGFVLGFLAAILSALALIMVRSLNSSESPGAIAFYFVVASMLGALLTLPFGWLIPDSNTLMLLVGAGLFGGFAHIAMTLAFRYAEASRLAPFEYIALLWPVLADLWIFQTSLSTSFIFALPFVLGGAALAAAEKAKVKPAN